MYVLKYEVSQVIENIAKLTLSSFVLDMSKNYTLNVFLFVVNMRIVGTDENLRPLTGKVKICFLLLKGLHVMSVVIQFSLKAFMAWIALCCKIPNYQYNIHHSTYPCTLKPT